MGSKKPSTIIEGLEEYLRKCPLLEKGAFRVDALSPKPVEYCIEVGIFDPVLAQYVNGDQLKQYQFNFCSRNFYGFDRIMNMQNSGFYERFAQWLKEQNWLGNLPKLPDYCEPDTIEATSSGYIFDGAGQNARYQIACRLTYYEDARQAGDDTNSQP